MDMNRLTQPRPFKLWTPGSAVASYKQKGRAFVEHALRVTGDQFAFHILWHEEDRLILAACDMGRAMTATEVYSHLQGLRPMHRRTVDHILDIMVVKEGIH